MTIKQLFFELIQVALGTRIYLSHTPSADKWGELYAMAKKQSLVGVCFAGVQRLQSQQQEPPERLYLTWMGMAAKIQQRNEVVNRQCVELQAKLAADGFRSSILKGQGVAASYGSLSLLRQSGDIDLWVDGGIKDTIRRFKQLGIELSNINIKHADARFFDDTEVEIHFRPSWFYSPIKDKKLRKWFEEQKNIQMNNRIGDMCAPTTLFNLIYLLLHAYRHMLDEGVGQRQVMDYYFVLRSISSFTVSSFKSVAEPVEVREGQKTIFDLCLNRFASALMWVLGYVFAMECEYMICEPDEKEGKSLLNEIMKGGNFGHHNTDSSHSKNVWLNGLCNFKRNIRYVPNYPSEVLCAPFWKLWHWRWRMIHGFH